MSGRARVALIGIAGLVVAAVLSLAVFFVSEATLPREEPLIPRFSEAMVSPTPTPTDTPTISPSPTGSEDDDDDGHRRRRRRGSDDDRSGSDSGDD